MTAVDSPVAAVFVPAPDHWPRKHPIRAIVIHMAEGGGTVSHLQKPDGNSSHYVVEYTGRVVQMVSEAQAAGSINPLEVRRTDDGPYTFLGDTIVYGATAAKAALGDAWLDPNAAVVAIETEGFAKTGPNAAQRSSLRRLVADIRSRRGPLAVLGHRDFQSYKACPGHRIPWADYGGHAPQEEAPDMPARSFRFDTTARSGNLVVKVEGPPKDHTYVRLATAENIAIPDGTAKRAFGPVTLVDQAGKPIGPGGPADTRTKGYVVGDEAAFLIEADVDFTPDAADAKHQVVISASVDGKPAGEIKATV